MSHALDPSIVATGLDMLREHIAAVPDFPQTGILFRDITPALADPKCLKTAVDLHLDAVADMAGEIDAIVGIESRGFLFGMPMAMALGVGFVPARKPGKLPRKVHEQRYTLEYGEDALQMHEGDLQWGQKVLVVDDLLATGGTASATCALIEQTGAQVLGCLFLIELTALGGRGKLGGHRVNALIGY